MAQLRVFHIRVDASFEHLLIVSWFRGVASCGPRQMYVQESRNVPQVEDAAIAKIDGLRKHLIYWNHVPRRNIPSQPQLFIFQK